MVKIKDVAAGVSTATVSRVLSDHPHVRPEVRDRMLAAVARLTIDAGQRMFCIMYTLYKLMLSLSRVACLDSDRCSSTAIARRSLP